MDEDDEILTRLFYAIGAGKPGGFGLEPLGWSDIDSWARLTGNVLRPWQHEAFFAMSRAYTGEFNKAGKKDEFRTPPWRPEESAAMKSERMLSSMRRIAKRKRNG